MATNQTVLWEEVWKRTPNAKHFHLLDGSKQAVIFMGDVHYQDVNGFYQNMDIILHDEAELDLFDFPIADDGKDLFDYKLDIIKKVKAVDNLDRERCSFQALKLPHTVKLPRNWQKGYTVGKDSERLNFISVGASPSMGILDEKRKSRLHYQDAWNDTDVILEVRDNGVKETIILKTDRSPTSFSFEVIGGIADNLTLGKMKIQPAWLADSSGVTRDVAQIIRREGAGVFLDLVADVTGLIFPVTIDPTLVIQPDPTAGKDTYVSGSSPTTNYGTSSVVVVGGSSSELPKRGLFQFDISSIPSAAYVSNAFIELNVDSVVTSAAKILTTYKVTSYWDEATVTWNTQPTIDPTIVGSISVGGTSDVPDFDVTSIVAAHVSGASMNYGIMIKSPEVASTSEGKSFVSSDNTSVIPQRSLLTVSHNSPPTAPVLTAPNGGETWNASQTMTWTPSTDAANSTITDTGVARAWYSTLSIAASSQRGNTFINPTPGKLTSVRLKLYVCPAGGTYNLNLYATSAGLPTTLLYTQVVTQVTAITNTETMITVPITTPPTLAGGVTYAICIGYLATAISTESVTGSYAGGQPVSYNGTTWSTSASNDIPFEMTVTESTAQANLTYQLALSIDGGATYPYTLAALTAPGATSLVCDFSAIPQSSLCLISIRAFDGTGYSAWDYSNGVFSIQHNQAPTAPTLLAPSSRVINRALTNRLSWQHNDPNAPDPQSKFDLMWSSDGGTTWTTVTQVTTNQYYDVVGNTFPHLNILWKVRTYDQAGLSGPYSSQVSLLAGDKPASATITAPIGVIAAPQPTLQWSSIGQMGIQIQAITGGSTVWDSGTVTTANKAMTCGITLLNNTSYTIQMRIINTDGLWSDWTTTAITVSYTAPATPSLLVSAKSGRIDITSINPNPTGSQPSVSFNDIYRRDLGTALWVRIAANVVANSTYSDYAFTSGHVYEYKATALGSNGTVVDSLNVQGSVALWGIWLHAVNNPSDTVLNLQLSQNRAETWKPDVVMTKYDGRGGLVAEFGQIEETNFKVDLSMKSSDTTWTSLYALARLKTILCVRDYRGRKVFGVIESLPETDSSYGQSVALEIAQVDYSEGV